METNKLIATGLSKPQALAYALLVERGEISPPKAAEKLGLTRTNSYKLFDRLVELGLAIKPPGNKAIYRLSNPSAMATLASELRDEAVAREEAINTVMKELLAKYYKHTEQPIIEIVSGRKEVADAFRRQIGLREDIFYIRSPADIASMGFDTLHEIRMGPSQLGRERHGILPDGLKGPVNHKSHKRSNLEITWVKHEDYNEPVEWSVSSSSLMIVLYGAEPHAITILNPVIASSFLQIWHILNSCLRTIPDYKSLPRLAISKESF